MKKTSNENKNQIITIRCTKKEKEQITENARNEGISHYLIRSGVEQQSWESLQKRISEDIECRNLINEIYHIVSQEDNSELQELIKKLLEQITA